MLDNSLIELIKQIALNAVENGQPCDFCYGKVISPSPLKILVENKLELSEMQLVLTRNVTDFETELDFGEEKVEKKSGHDHKILKHKVLVKNALKAGETVVLLRKRGGQSFLVLDRVVGK